MIRTFARWPMYFASVLQVQQIAVGPADALARLFEQRPGDTALAPPARGGTFAEFLHFRMSPASMLNFSMWASSSARM